MNAQIIAKEFYGYRKQSRQRGVPLTKIETIDQPRPGKWKVRFLEGPRTGELEIVSSSGILIPWPEASAFPQEEECMLKLLQACESQWSGSQDDPVMDAINLIFESTGEKEVMVDPCGRDMGHGCMRTDSARRILDRAGITDDVAVLDPLAFMDQEGILHITFAMALKMAQAFAAAEPDTVLISAESQQREYESKLDSSYRVEMLQTHRAACALVRQWASGAAAVTNRSLIEIRHSLQTGWEDLWKRFAETEQGDRNEIQRLRNMLMEAAELLRSKGAEKEADRILLRLYQPFKDSLRIGPLNIGMDPANPFFSFGIMLANRR
jgi:hypothetical protein